MDLFANLTLSSSQTNADIPKQIKEGAYGFPVHWK